MSDLAERLLAAIDDREACAEGDQNYQWEIVVRACAAHRLIVKRWSRYADLGSSEPADIAARAALWACLLDVASIYGIEP